MKPCWSCRGRGYFGTSPEENPELSLKCAVCNGTKEVSDDEPSTFAEAVEREKAINKLIP
jgi:hypothetical protein